MMHHLRPSIHANYASAPVSLRLTMDFPDHPVFIQLNTQQRVDAAVSARMSCIRTQLGFHGHSGYASP